MTEISCNLIVVVVSELYTSVKMHYFVNFQRMQFGVHKLDLNKAGLKKENWRRKVAQFFTLSSSNYLLFSLCTVSLSYEHGHEPVAFIIAQSFFSSTGVASVP